MVPGRASARRLRVLLVSANTEKLPDPVFPIGAAYVASAAASAGHEVETLDLCFEPSPGAALAAAVRAFTPDVVGISLRNLDSSAYPENTSYVADYRALVAQVRSLTDAPVVLGGAGFTVTPRALLAALGADVGVVGEGERAFPWLLERLAGGAPLESGDGFLVEPEGAGVLLRSASRIRDLDAFGRPSRRHFDLDLYYQRGGALNVQTKRGCHFECVFCSYPLIEGSRVRMRTPARVVDEIEAERREHGVRHWFFVDNIFNAPIRHAKEICEEMVRRRLDVEWSAYLNPKFVDEELCDLLVRSGCKAIEFGTDAGSPTTIAALRKTFDVDDLRRASALCRRHELKFCHSLIFGGPGETRTTVEETLALMDELRPTAVIAMTGVRILPGTAMVEIAIRDGQLEPDDDLLEPRFYLSPALRGELVDRIEAHARARPNWIVPGRSIRTNVEVLQRLRERRVKGQLWRLLR